MPHVKGLIHGIAAMATLVVGAVLTDIVSEHADAFRRLSLWTAELLIDVGDLPIEEEVASIVVPVGTLMGCWVFLYELKETTGE